MKTNLQCNHSEIHRPLLIMSIFISLSKVKYWLQYAQPSCCNTSGMQKCKWWSREETETSAWNMKSCWYCDISLYSDTVLLSCSNADKLNHSLIFSGCWRRYLVMTYLIPSTFCCSFIISPILCWYCVFWPLISWKSVLTTVCYSPLLTLLL